MRLRRKIGGMNLEKLDKGRNGDKGGKRKGIRVVQREE